MKKKRYLSLFIHLLLIFSILVIAAPIIFTLIVSSQSFEDVFTFPPRFIPGKNVVDNYTTAWQRVNMGRLLLNSLAISIAVALGKIVLSILAAFAFTYFGDFPGKGVCFVLILITHMLPLPVRIVPTFELMQDFSWVDTYYALTVPFFASATGVLLFRQFFLTVPHSYAEAARIDGAGPIQFLTRILVPLAFTNITALFLIEFIYMWNQYLWPLVVTNSNQMQVVQIGIKMLLASEAQAAEWNVIMAGTIIALLPPLIILILLQKSLVVGFALQEQR